MQGSASLRSFVAQIVTFSSKGSAPFQGSGRLVAVDPDNLTFSGRGAAEFAGSASLNITGAPSLPFAGRASTTFGGTATLTAVVEPVHVLGKSEAPFSWFERRPVDESFTATSVNVLSFGVRIVNIEFSPPVRVRQTGLLQDSDDVVRVSRLSMFGTRTVLLETVAGTDFSATRALSDEFDEDWRLTLEDPDTGGSWTFFADQFENAQNFNYTWLAESALAVSELAEAADAINASRKAKLTIGIDPFPLVEFGSEATLTAVPPVDFEARDDTSFDGAATLTAVDPPAVSFTGSAEASFSGNATLSNVEPPTVSFGGIGGAEFGALVRFAVVDPEPVGISMKGSAAYGGSATLSKVLPPGTSIGGAGASSFGAEARLDVIDPPAISFGGVGAATAGGTATLTTLPLLEFAGRSNTAFGGSARLAEVDPPSVSFGSIGTAAFSGSALLSGTAATTFSFSEKGQGLFAWLVEEPVAESFVSVNTVGFVSGNSFAILTSALPFGGTVVTEKGLLGDQTETVKFAELRVTVNGNNNFFQVQMLAGDDEDPSRPLSAEFEANWKITLEEWDRINNTPSGGSWTFFAKDFTYANNLNYAWTTRNNDVVADMIAAAAALRVTRVVRITLSIDPAPAVEYPGEATITAVDLNPRLVTGTGSAAFGGMVSLAAVDPDPIAFASKGRATVGGMATLTVADPTAISVGASGSAAFAGSALLRSVDPDAVSVGSVGTATFRTRRNTLSRTAPAAVDFDGKGSSAFGGNATLSIDDPTGISFGGIGSTRFRPRRTRLRIRGPAAISITARGEGTFGSEATLSVDDPTAISVSGSAQTAFGGTARLFEIDAFPTRFMGKGSAPFNGEASLSVVDAAAISFGASATAMFGAAPHRLTVISPDAVEVVGKGTATIGGSATLTISDPMAIEVVGFGRTTVGGVATLTTVEPADIAVTGKDTSAVGGTARLTVSEADDITFGAAGTATFRVRRTRLRIFAPAAVSFSGSGTAAFSGEGSLAIVGPSARQVSGAGEASIGGAATLTAVDPSAIGVTGKAEATFGAQATLTASDPSAISFGASGTAGFHSATQRLTNVPAEAVLVSEKGTATVGAEASLTTVAPSEIQVSGSGVSTLGGAATLTTVDPSSIDVTEKGTATVGAEATLTTVEPATVAVGSRGSTAFSGEATLTEVDPDSVSFGASGTASFQSVTQTLTNVPAEAVEVAGRGSVSVGGQASLTVADPTSISISGTAQATFGGQARLTDRDAVSVPFGATGRTAFSGTATLTVADPEAIAVEGKGASVFGGAATLTGVSAPAISFGAAGRARFRVRRQRLRIEGPAAVEFAGRGAVTVEGQATLSILRPSERQVSGTGSAAFSGTATLSHVEPDAITIEGKGTATFGGAAGMRVTDPASVSFGATGRTTFSGRATLTGVEPDSVAVEGKGTGTVGGQAALSIVPVGDIQVTGAGSAAFLGSATLSGMSVPPLFFEGGKGSAPFSWLTFQPVAEHFISTDSGATLVPNVGLMNIRFGRNVQITNEHLLPDNGANVFLRLVTMFYSGSSVRVTAEVLANFGNEHLSEAFEEGWQLTLQEWDQSTNSVTGEAYTFSAGDEPNVNFVYVDGTNYSWTNVNEGDGLARVTAAINGLKDADAVRVTLGLADPVVAAYGGDATLTAVDPPAVSIGAVGTVSAGGEAELTAVDPDTIQVDGFGRATFGGRVALAAVDPPAVSFGAVGTGTFSGLANLVQIDPPSVTFGSKASTSFGASATLISADPSAILVNARGSVSVGGSAVLTNVDPDTRLVSGTGGAAFGGMAELVAVEASPVTFDGRGTAPFGGSATLAAVDPPGVSFGAIGSAAFSGSAALSGTSAPTLPFYGRGSAIFGGSGILVATDITELSFGGKGRASFGGTAVLTEQDEPPLDIEFIASSGTPSAFFVVREDRVTDVSFRAWTAPPTASFRVTTPLPSVVLSQPNLVTVVGQSVRFPLSEAADGLPPYVYTLEGLPDELSFVAASRTIQGIPRAITVYTLTYSVTDATGAEKSTTFRLTVRTELAYTPIEHPPELTQRWGTETRTPDTTRMIVDPIDRDERDDRYGPGTVVGGAQTMSVDSGTQPGPGIAEQLQEFLYKVAENLRYLNARIQTVGAEDEHGAIGEAVISIESINRSGQTITVTYTDGTTDSFTLADGEDGTSTSISSITTNEDGSITVEFDDGKTIVIPRGQAGRGIMSIGRDGDTVTVTYDDNSTPDTFTVMDGADGLPGKDYGTYAPWAYGLLYNNRNENSAVSSSGGAWTLTKEVAGTESQVAGEDPIPWDDVTKITLSQRDAEGIDRRVFFASKDLETGRLMLGIRRDLDTPENPDIAAFRQSGPPVDNKNTTWTLPVQRDLAAMGFDEGTPDDIVPPLASDYSVRLLIPDINRVSGFPTSRTLGLFWAEVSAAVATALAAIDDDDPWPAAAIAAANEATPDENVPGDTVTLYRGSSSWTRSWDGTNWRPAEQFIDGLLVVNGSIVAAALAAHTITADKIAAGAITTETLKADAVTANKIAANAITATKIAAGAITARAILIGVGLESGNSGELQIGDIQSTNFMEGLTGWRIRQSGEAEFDAATIRGVLAAEHLEPTVISVRTMFSGNQSVGRWFDPDESDPTPPTEIELTENNVIDEEWWNDRTGQVQCVYAYYKEGEISARYPLWGEITIPIRELQGQHKADLHFNYLGIRGGVAPSGRNIRGAKRGGFVFGNVLYLLQTSDASAFYINDDGSMNYIGDTVAGGITPYSQALSFTVSPGSVSEPTSAFATDDTAYVLSSSGRISAYFLTTGLRPVGRSARNFTVNSSVGGRSAKGIFGDSGTAYVWYPGTTTGEVQAWTLTNAGAVRDSSSDFSVSSPIAGANFSDACFSMNGMAYFYVSTLTVKQWVAYTTGGVRSAADDWTPNFSPNRGLVPNESVGSVYVVGSGSPLPVYSESVGSKPPVASKEILQIFDDAYLRMGRSTDGRSIFVGTSEDIDNTRSPDAVLLVKDLLWITGFRGADSDIPDSATAPGAPRADSSTRFRWFDPVDNGGTSILRFEYRLDGGESAFTTRRFVDPTHLKNWTDGTRYSFEVRAHNSIGPGPWLQISGTVRTPTAPTNSPGITTRIRQDQRLGTVVDYTVSGRPSGGGFGVQAQRQGNAFWSYVTDRSGVGGSGTVIHSSGSCYRAVIWNANEFGLTSDVVFGSASCP